jgi:hypothetical protein
VVAVNGLFYFSSQGTGKVELMWSGRHLKKQLAPPLGPPLKILARKFLIQNRPSEFSS